MSSNADLWVDRCCAQLELRNPDLAPDSVTVGRQPPCRKQRNPVNANLTTDEGKRGGHAWNAEGSGRLARF